MASLLLIALLVLPWLVVARRRQTRLVPARRAWTPPAPRQPQEAWVDPDDWWRQASALPSRSPRVDAQQAAPALEG